MLHAAGHHLAALLVNVVAMFNGQGSNEHMSCLGLQEDWIGLRELDVGGRLEFKEAGGPHMHFTLDW